jgi:hypothetical protein
MHRSEILSALRNIRGVTDVSRLFSLLGYRPEGEPRDGNLWVAARWQNFLVLACQDTDPCQAARSHAARLARAAECAIVVALGDDDRLVLAAPKIGENGSTRLATISRTQPTPAMLQLLEDLSPKAENSLGHAIRVAEILTSETAGERFFSAFRTILERMADSLDHRHSRRDRRMAALIALTRVLFLYFVQAKGWLDGRSDYLRNLLDQTLSRKRHFHRSALDPLFFGALNRQPAERSRRIQLGRIPYLNGGLFEPHPVEKRIGPVAFSNRLWRDAFDMVFERFRFCVREAEEVDAIAPDMLGRVFERIMESEERHLTGTFYTPESVVRRIVRATIETALPGCCGITPDLASRIMNCEELTPAERRAARTALRELRLLDPAVGSGAFLLGALECLTEIRLPLLEDPAPNARWVLRRRILKENLFGVDLSPVAVRLAELRLWLAVVADDPTTDIAAVAPLPNLDGIVRQGDSLFDPLSAARALGAGLGLRPEAAERVRKLRELLFEARGPAHSALLAKLRREETELAAHLVRDASERIEALMADLAAAAGGRDLFGRRAGLDPAQRRRYRALKQQRLALRRVKRQLADGTLPFFAFEVHAPEICAAGGFTAVVGNPPWVRAERLAPELRRALLERFGWWRSSARRGFGHLPDIAVAFLERALELTRTGGAVGLLLPSKIASASYGETARAHLARESTIAYLHRVPPEEAAAFGATTYPVAMILKKEPPRREHLVRLDFDRHKAKLVRQEALRAPGPWILVEDRSRAALEELKSSGRPLAEVAPPALGVKTGADGVFVGRLLRTEDQIAAVELAGETVELEAYLLRPALRGRDLRPFRADPSKVLLYAHRPSGTPLDRLPPLASRYLQKHRPLLAARADAAARPIWAIFRLRAALGSHRIVWADISRRPAAVALDETPHSRALPLNTCYVASAPDRESALATVAVMNSTWTQALVSVTADEARGGYRRINARVAGEIPVPHRSAEFDRLVSLSRSAHSTGSCDQDVLDTAVADALGLSADAREALRALASDHS